MRIRADPSNSTRLAGGATGLQRLHFSLPKGGIGSTVDPHLFQSVAWSTPRTLQQTLSNAERLAYRVAVLERWFDLDEWKDVERFLATAPQGRSLPSNLAAFLQQLCSKSSKGSRLVYSGQQPGRQNGNPG